MILLTREEFQRKTEVKHRNRSQETNEDEDEDEDMGNNGTAGALTAGTSADNRFNAKFRLEEIRSINHRYVKNSIPGHIEADAVNEMIRTYVQCRNEECNNFIQDIQNCFQIQVTEAIRQSFGHWIYLPLYSMVQQLATEFITQAFNKEREFLPLVCTAEKKYLFTLDANRMSQVEALAIKSRKEARDQACLDLLHQEAGSVKDNKRKTSARGGSMVN